MRAGRTGTRRGSRSRGGEELGPEADDGSESSSRLGVGCAVGCSVLVLLAGAVGIGVGAHRRLASWQGEGGATDDQSSAEAPSRPDAGIAGSPAGGRDDSQDPLEAMRGRYQPGPQVRIESMVPSGRLLPDARVNARGNQPVGRTLDNPWVVVGAELRPSAPPSAAPPSPPRPGARPGGAPRVWNDPAGAGRQPLTVLPRTPARAQVRARDASGGTEITAYVVWFEGYPGHFFLPATIPTELGHVQASGSDGATIHFAIQAPILPGGASAQPGERFDVTMRIAAVDAEGRSSAPASRPLSVVAVGAGDVEVTLTMGEATDLDLYVVDPTGVTIYFGNTSSVSGGRLDLDANAACSSNVGVDNEHVFWPAGRAPAGTYRVHVAHYMSCIQGRPVDYRVTVSACGETVVLSGRFDGRANDQRCMAPGRAHPSWCQRVVTFAIPPC